jgi:CheY-like chemotaxis protein
MAKIMLVEDDNNLREIYEARLLAEGYQIVSAKDGEEALALAVKEKPDLIISDVMMPKISGFDMLDILRSTPETKNTKVIMMTALSQTEDKGRADKLGADRYLVKSQVTLEDVAKVAEDVLNGGEAPAAVAPLVATQAEPAAATTTPAAPEPPVAAPEPIQPSADPTPVVDTPDPFAQATATPDPTPSFTTPVEEPTTSPVPPASQDPAEMIPAPSEATPVSVPVSVPAEENAPTTVPTEVSSAPEPETTPESTASPLTSEPIATTDSEELAQSTQDETAQAESQINEILAQAVEPESDEPLAPPPAIEPSLTNPEAEASDELEVAPAPQESSETVVTPQPTIIPVQEQTVAEAPAEATTPPTEDSSNGQLQDNTDSAINGGKKVIQPISDPTEKPDLNELLKQEEAKSAEPVTPVADQVVAPNPDTQPPSQSQSGGIVSPNDISL